jgi:hypothetical protein
MYIDITCYQRLGFPVVYLLHTIVPNFCTGFPYLMSAACTVHWIAQNFAKTANYCVLNTWPRFVAMFIWKEIPSAEFEYI